jgi:ATP phosphoribosyltransferase regulatory subunit HisZ
MLISITEIKKRERDYLCKALKSKLLLGISSNTYQAKVFRVKRTERERESREQGGIELGAGGRLGSW